MKIRVFKFSPNPRPLEIVWVSWGSKEKIKIPPQMIIVAASLNKVWLFSLLINLVMPSDKKKSATIPKTIW